MKNGLAGIYVFISLLFFMCMGIDSIAQDSKGALGNNGSVNVKVEPPKNDVGASTKNGAAWSDKEWFELIISLIIGFTTVALVVLGVVIGVNIYTGWRELKETRLLLDKITPLYEQYQQKIVSFEKEKDDLFKGAAKEIDKLVDEKKASIAEEVRTLVQFSLASIDAKKAMVELETIMDGEQADVERAYALLSKMVSHPMSESIRIYADTLKKFAGNADIARIVSTGLGNCQKMP